MPANIPDLGAVAHLGGQFNTNIFHTASKNLNKISHRLQETHEAQQKQTAMNRERFAQSALRGVQQGQRAYANSQAKNAAAASKTMQQQRNYAHGEALKFQSAQFKVKQQQTNYAHGQAIMEANRRAKGASTNVPVTKTPSLVPTFSSSPQVPTPTVASKPIPQASFSSQLVPQKPLGKPKGSPVATFSSGPSPTSAPSVTRSGSVTGPQFPQHVHPAGSSMVPLSNLTVNQPKPNTFTVGSRNAKPGGIAAKGSQLEAWAIQRQAQAKQQRQNPGQ